MSSDSQNTESEYHVYLRETERILTEIGLLQRLDDFHYFEMNVTDQRDSSNSYQEIVAILQDNRRRHPR